MTAYTAQCIKDVNACYFTAFDITVLDGSSYKMTMTQNSLVINYVNCTVRGSAICTASLTEIGGADTTTTTTFFRESSHSLTAHHHGRPRQAQTRIQHYGRSLKTGLDTEQSERWIVTDG